MCSGRRADAGFPSCRVTPLPIKLSSPATREFWELPVLFEDGQMLALEKPAKLLTSPDRYDPRRPNLMKLLHAGISDGKPWAASRGLTYLANVHRLDFETSGVLLLAKDKPTLVRLASLFGTAKPVKHYVALVQGNPAERQFEVDLPIAPHPRQVGRMHVDRASGKKSRTQFEVLEAFRGYTLLRCRPITGRTHQIRIHLRHLHLPIVGDQLYLGKPLLLSSFKPGYRLKPGRTERPLIDSVALHAERLELPHPSTGNPVVIESPWPKDLRVALKYLRQCAAGPANPLVETNVTGDS